MDKTNNCDELTCIYCRNCIAKNIGFECYAWGQMIWISPFHAKTCPYFESYNRKGCRTMMKERVENEIET